MKQIFTLAIAATISVFSFKATAQGVALNTNGNKADTSAMLDVSSTTKGLLAPRMTAAQKSAIVTPATGLLVYQTDAPIGFYYYDGSAWVTLKGVAGTNGTNGTNGQGVPTGGTAGQVLSKVNGTDYNTQWTTPASGSGIITVLNATNGSAQTISPLQDADITFSANQTVASGYGFFNGTTYRASSTGAGTYLVTVSVYSNVAATTLTLIVSGSTYSVTSGASNLSQIVVLPNSGTIKVNGLNSNSTYNVTTSTDGTTRFNIVKLN